MSDDNEPAVISALNGRPQKEPSVKDILADVWRNFIESVPGPAEGPSIEAPTKKKATDDGPVAPSFDEMLKHLNEVHAAGEQQAQGQREKDQRDAEGWRVEQDMGL